MPTIPLVDTRAQYAPVLTEVLEALEGVLASGEFILGPNVKAFEREAAEYLGVPQTIGVANGTDAIVIVLDALGIGPGDEVICPAFTFYATAESIVRRGATPVFADVDPATMNLDPADVAERITDRTKAIMPVHLFGRPAALGELAELGLPIVELQAAEIGTGVYYTRPLHLQPALRFLGWEEGSLPNTEQIARENFSLPLWAGIDQETQERVVDVVRTAAPVRSAG